MRHKASGSIRSGAASQRIEAYRAAMRWRRAADAALKDVDLTLAQWLVLESTASIISETKDAVSQAKVAAHAAMDPMTVSQVMRTLEDKDLVNRGPDATGPAYRVIVTERGERALAKGRAVIEAIGAEDRDEPRRPRPRPR